MGLEVGVGAGSEGVRVAVGPPVAVAVTPGLVVAVADGLAVAVAVAAGLAVAFWVAFAAGVTAAGVGLTKAADMGVGVATMIQGVCVGCGGKVTNLVTTMTSGVADGAGVAVAGAKLQPLSRANARTETPTRAISGQSFMDLVGSCRLEIVERLAQRSQGFVAHLVAGSDGLGQLRVAIVHVAQEGRLKIADPADFDIV